MTGVIIKSHDAFQSRSRGGGAALCGRGVCAHLRWPRRGRPSPGRGGRDSVSGRWAGDGRGAVSPGLGSGARTGRMWPSADISAPKRRTLHSKCETVVLSKKTLCSAFCYFFPEMKSALVTVLDIHRALRYCLVMTPGFLMKLQKRLFVSPHRSSPPCQDSPCTTWLRTKGSGELCGARGRAPTTSSSFASHVCPVTDPGVLNRYPRPGSFS